MDDRYWLSRAIQLAEACPPSDTAFSVGAIVVADDAVVTQGYSRQFHPHDHAEEVALRGAQDIPSTATIYSSLEPCGRRASRPVTCAQLIIDAGIQRVVFAWGEPPTFVAAVGGRVLREAAITVVQLSELAPAAARVNAHLLR